MERDPATTPARPSRIPSWLLAWPTRVLVTAILVGIVALQIDWNEIGDQLRGGDWRWFAAAVVLLCGALFVGAVRWHAFVRAAGLHVSLWTSVRAYYAGALSNNALPTAFGGDVARAVMVGGRDGMVSAATSVTVDRVTSIACLILLAAFAAAVDPQDAPGELRLLAGAAALAMVAVGVLLVVVARAEPVRRRVPARVRPIATAVAATLRDYAASRSLLLSGIVLGFVYQVLVVIETVWLGKAIGLEVDAELIAIVLPLVLIVTLIPISVAGFGLREGGFVALLGVADVSAGQATVLSLLSVAAMALASAPGAFALLTRGGTRLAPPPPDAEPVP